MKRNLINSLKYFAYQLKIGLYHISNKKIDYPSICRNKMHVKRTELSYFTLSANTITIVNTGGTVYFFREVLPHNRKDDYFRVQIGRFLQICIQGIANENFNQEIPIQTKFSQSYVNNFSRWLRERFVKPKDFLCLSKSDYVLRRERFSIWKKDAQMVKNPSLMEIGLSGLYDNFPEIAPLFLSYMSGSAYCYRVNHKNIWETFYAQKSIASYMVAKQLGVQSLITEAIPTELITEDGSIYGILSPRADGKRAQDSHEQPTPFNQRDLASLWILDLICYQLDHAPNNYNVISSDSNKNKNTICAFDNDNMRTFFPVFNVTNYIANKCSKLVNDDNHISIPHLDKKLGEAILNTSAKDISSSLKPYLNWLQRKALCSRYNSLQNVLKETIAEKPDFLLDNSSWNHQTMLAERSGKYGRTYLTLLFEYVDNHVYD